MRVRKWENFTTLPRPTPAELPGLSERTLSVLHARRAAQGRFPAGTVSPELELVTLVELRLNVQPGLSPSAAVMAVLCEALTSDTNH